MPTDLRSISTFKELTRYLEDELDWPLGEYEFEDLTFTYEPSELGLKAEDAVKVKTIRQLRPFRTNQPWGIFFVEFEKKNLPIVVLRRILRHLVLKKRASANAADAKRWQSRDLLFISAWGDEARREMTFAHFVDHPEMGLAELRVLGWDDDDTPLHMNQVAARLGEKLRWDEDLAADPEAWRDQWSSAFVLRHRHVITKSEELAAALAELARRLRNRLRTILRMEDGFGEIRKLQRAFREGLIHDLTDDGFADMFAQTVTYGLFSVSVRRTFPGEGTAIIKDDVPNLIFTSPFLKEMLGIFLGIKSRKGAIDFDELGVSDVTDLLTSPDTHMEVVLADFNNKTRGEDPVIHFYEHFLKAYNKELKVQRGVFYTPQPVVSYIVRSVHELLQSEFGLEHGLADTITWGEFIQKGSAGVPPAASSNSTQDARAPLSLPTTFNDKNIEVPISEDEPFVQILDPATGTATFLVEVIDVIHNHLKSQWKARGAAAMPRIPLPENCKLNTENFAAWWNCYVPHSLLPRLHAFELMMAPYAIAHMKIGLKLAETGYLFATEERARIYLTNALEPWVKQLPLIGFDALAHEAAAVNEIKRHKRFTVIIGNPPYSGISSNMTEYAQRIVDAYKFVDGAVLNEKKLWLQDDYVKFIRKAQTTIENARIGVLGYITNNGYLDNPTFRGMRQSLIGSFQTLDLLDLHGNSSKKEESPDGTEDKNVFDIKQGVSICLGIHGAGQTSIKHADLWGSKESKYQWLGNHSTTTTPFITVTPSSPDYTFAKQDAVTKKEYSAWISIWDAFGTYGTGIVTGRDALTTNSEKGTLLENLKSFASLSEEDARAAFSLGPDARDWKVSTAQKDLRENPPSLKALVQIQYRPFDKRWTHYTGSARGINASPCRSTMIHMLKGNNLGLISARSNASSANDHFFVTRNITEAKCGESSRQCALFPLRLLAATQSSKEGTFDFNDASDSNFSDDFTRKIKQTYLEKSRLLTPEDIFHYIYAVFHSPGYRTRYAEFLKIDFPRLPLTGNLELFRALARLGGELTALHLLESHKLDKPITEFNGPRNPVVEKITWSDDTVWVDKKQTVGFQGVPEDVWNFHIGGYQVCHKWLKDRKGRTLTADDIAHYQKISIALSETIRLMAEIDEVIAQHGGWPEAFQTSGGTETAPSDDFPLTPEASPKPSKPKATLGSAFIPGELFEVEGELKPIKKAKAARKAAKPQLTSAPRQSAPDKNDLMALIREIMAKHGPCDRDTLTKHCAQAMEAAVTPRHPAVMTLLEISAGECDQAAMEAHLAAIRAYFTA